MFFIALKEEITADPVKELVLQFLASYLGIVAGVAFLVSGVKWAMRRFVEGREPLWAIALTFAFGTAAKIIMPDVYGSNNLQGWALHEIVLLFAAIGAQQFHDKIMNPLTGKILDGKEVDPLKAPPLRRRGDQS
jgi:hypothetical protein